MMFSWPRLLVLALLCLPAWGQAAERTVADIIGPVARIRVDVLEGHKQVFISDPADVAAVLAAIDVKQRPRRAPPNEAFFKLNLVFFDADGAPHSQLSFFGDVDGGNRLVRLAFSSTDVGTLRLADAKALARILDRVIGPRRRKPDATQAPALVPVATGQALRLAAPAGWSVRVEPPRDPTLSTIARVSPACSRGPDISVLVQLDQKQPSPEALLVDQYPRRKPTRLRGWSCVVDAGNFEAFCAGRVAGLHGVVSTYFATVDEAAFSALGGGDLAAAVAASLGWSGGAPETLSDWSRDAEAAAQTKLCHPR
jgi:hypothetical protein